MPEAAPTQFKLGYSKDVKARLRSHQGLCPQARLVQHWICADLAEEKRTLQAVATLAFVQQIGREVFLCEDVQVLLNFLDSLLPRPTPTSVQKKTRKRASREVNQPSKIEYLTIEEAASILRIPPLKLSAWIRAGKVTYWRAGRTIRIPTEEVVRLASR